MNQKNLNSPRGEALRTKVLNTALRLFSQQGYFNTSIHDIKREAGVSIGAIYHHFENKEAIAYSLYESLLQLMENEIEAVIAVEKSSHGKCAAIIAKLFELTTEQSRNMQFILLAQHREYLPDEAPICSSRPFQIMKNVVVDGMHNGEIREMEPWVAATTMFGGALRMMNLELDGILTKPLSHYLSEVTESAWTAIKA